MTKDNTPTITTPAPLATWEYQDPKRQFGDNTTHYVQARNGNITIRIRGNEMLITKEMVPWFVDSINQAREWMEEQDE